MDRQEMLDALIKANNEKEKKVKKEVLESVLNLVIKNPLERDRHMCQERITEIINQSCKEE